MLALLGIGLAECLVYTAATVNVRACAKGRLLPTVTTDALIAGLNFTLIVAIAETNTWSAQASYIIGAALGSLTGMWLTAHWKEGER